MSNNLKTIPYRY